MIVEELIGPNYGKPGICIADLPAMSPEDWELDGLKRDVGNMVACRTPLDETALHIDKHNSPTGTIDRWRLDRPHASGWFPSLDAWMSWFKEAEGFSLLRLSPGAELAPRKLQSVRRAGKLPQLVLRVYLPVQCGRLAVVGVNERIYQFKEGRAYYVNHGCVHTLGNYTDWAYFLTWDMPWTPAVADMFDDGKALPEGPPYFVKPGYPAEPETVSYEEVVACVSSV